VKSLKVQTNSFSLCLCVLVVEKALKSQNYLGENKSASR
jgi:hypothetical protein